MKTSETLYDALVLDNMNILTPACFVDFFLDQGSSQDKFGALRDAALGNLDAAQGRQRMTLPKPWEVK